MAGLSVIFKAVDEISSRFEAMTSAGTKALESFDKIEKSADASLSKMTDKAEETSEALSDATTATDVWTDALGNYDKGAMEAICSTEELVDMGYKTEDALTAEAEAAKKASEELGGLGDKTEDTGDKSEKFGKKSQEAVMGLDDVLTAAGIVVALKAIGDAFSECSAASAEFETNIAMVTTVADMTVTSADELSNQISALSVETAKSVNELSEATYNAISAGVATEDAVATVGSATKLATAGFTSSSSALSVLTTALNAYQLNAEELTKISDSLVVSQNLGVMTIDQLSSSIGKAISTASAYSVDLYNLESGYISLTKAGIGVDESTTYISGMMNELGKSSSNVAKILMEETGKSFGQLMQEGNSLGDVLGILYESVNQDSEALMNLWGSAEAGKAGNAIINQGLEKFNDNLNQLTNSTGITQRAYEAMTDTTTHSTERMQNSFANLSIAVGDDLNPVVGGLQNGIANITDGFAELIEEHPAIMGVFTGVITTVSIATLGIGAYTVATKVAALATKAWTEAMKINPIFLAITAVTALTAGIVAMAAIMDDSEDEFDSLSYATRKQYTELQDLNDEYADVCDKFGETSKEAQALKEDIDNLSKSYSDGKKTMDEWVEEFDTALASYQQFAEDRENTIDDMQLEGEKIYSLVTRLDHLATQTDLSAAEQQEMLAIINALNEKVPELSLSYDEFTHSLNLTAEAIQTIAEAAVNQTKYDTLQDQLEKSIMKRTELTNILSSAEKEYNATLAEQEKAQDKLTQAVEASTKANEAYTKPHGGGEAEGRAYASYIKDYAYATQNARDELEEMNEELSKAADRMNQAQQEIDDNEGAIKSMSEEMAELNGVMTHSEDTTITYEQAVVTATESVSEELTLLAEAYDATYEAARSSIDGQIGLFDEMVTESELTVEDMKAAFESQSEFIDKYVKNLERASELGLSEGLISSLSDGSAESAGQLDAIISKIDELGTTSFKAEAFISDFNKSFEGVQTAKDTFADTVATMETDFNKNMDSISQKMSDAVEDMNMSTQAAQAAKNTMDAYIEAIKLKTPEINSALDAITISSSNIFGRLNGYATGTNSAESGLALVGEDGPEIVAFGGGEVVYPADVTERIINNSSDDDFYIAPSEAAEKDSTEKIITLRIEGAGEIKVGNGVSKESVVTWLQENIKDTLFSLVEQEKEEEGDLAYEF